jgi:hypothetical protein
MRLPWVASKAAGKVSPMSINLFAYLDTAPSLEDMRGTLAPLGLVYRHTLPADDRWEYAMHVFGRTNLRVVYHAGDPQRGEALVDSAATEDTHDGQVAIQMVVAAVIRHYGGSAVDPRELQRGAVF